VTGHRAQSVLIQVPVYQVFIGVVAEHACQLNKCLSSTLITQRNCNCQNEHCSGKVL